MFTVSVGTNFVILNVSLVENAELACLNTRYNKLRSLENIVLNILNFDIFYYLKFVIFS